MSDYLQSLIAQTRNQDQEIQPRLPGRFEPWRSGGSLMTSAALDRQPPPDPDTPWGEFTQTVVVPSPHAPLPPPLTPPASAPSFQPTPPPASSRPFSASPLQKPSSIHPMEPVAPADLSVFSPPLPSLSIQRSPTAPLPATQDSALSTLQPSVPIVPSPPRAASGDEDPQPAPLRPLVKTPDRQPSSQSQPTLVPKPPPMPVNRVREQQEPTTLAAGSSAAPPKIQVTIGRIEVRLTPPAIAAPTRPQPIGPPLSLEDYLRLRRGERP